jgi:NAD(P)-dependent dehydrogenase (short-subunit alcohol dehydrogenase family)
MLASKDRIALVTGANKGIGFEIVSGVSPDPRFTVDAKASCCELSSCDRTRDHSGVPQRYAPTDQGESPRG